jgi:hypothetical protein
VRAEAERGTHRRQAHPLEERVTLRKDNRAVELAHNAICESAPLGKQEGGIGLQRALPCTRERHAEHTRWRLLRISVPVKRRCTNASTHPTAAFRTISAITKANAARTDRLMLMQLMTQQMSAHNTKYRPRVCTHTHCRGGEEALSEGVADVS